MELIMHAFINSFNFSLCTCIPYIILKLKPFENKEQQDTSKHTTKKMIIHRTGENICLCVSGKGFV